jgi:hypothetical protein
MKIQQYGYIKDGVLKILNKKRLDAEVKDCPNMDVQIIIKKKGKRSSQSNRYYWGVIVEEIRLELLRRGYRYDAETVHEWLKLKFNPEKIVIEETGEVIEIGQTTTEMNQQENGEYMERIIEWAASSLEIHISPPNTQTNLFAA